MHERVPNRSRSLSRPRRGHRGAVPTALAVATGVLAAGALAAPVATAAPSATARTSAPGPRSAASAPEPDRVQRTLDKLVHDDGLPAALAAVRRLDGPNRNYTAGVGDVATGAKVPRNGQVRIGSNTKSPGPGPHTPTPSWTPN
ncbi:hypothetical protein [Streptomyces flavofungini]|uniref:Uncharacterized protein n=1 Tax=Streptomyces flavofungini TaxID=68200 RepID=A0ABS0WZD9_9ACTN|nr:hypothetical protein [Streptomyces flavofungini]GHC46055.1 hypothetical protein GCM10010349_08650 [Streptomyces flavofungini]